MFDCIPPGTLVELEGPPERFIQLGSVLAVTCIIKHDYQRGPGHITWYHGGTKLDYDSPRGGISLQVSDLHLTRCISKAPSNVGRKHLGQLYPLNIIERKH